MLSSYLQGCLVLWIGRFDTVGYHQKIGGTMAEQATAAITAGANR